MGIKGTRTEQNLLKAFAGESQARNRYTYAAKVARKEGYEQIASLLYIQQVCPSHSSWMSSQFMTIVLHAGLHDIPYFTTK